MDPYLYKPIFLHLVVLFSIFETMKPAEDEIQLPDRSAEGTKIFLWAAFLILWLGFRPVSWAFGDTGNYAHGYYAIRPGTDLVIKSDVVFYSIMGWFAQSGFSIHVWFLLVEFVYIGGTAFAIYKFFPNRMGTAFAVVLSAFSFYSYGVNGIRNGMACSLFFVALVFVKERKWIWAAVLCLIAVNVHKSILLPIAALALANVYKNSKVYMACWVLCIGLALVAGSFFENLFMNQGLIDTGRNAAYYSNQYVDMSAFSHRGFRYDFLLYSCVPILVGYYFIAKKGFEDAWYKVMFNTYIISNSFWVLVNRNWLSNRIAFLSWFMYGFVLMYPLLMNPYVERRRTWILYAVLGNAGFSYFMWIIGKYI